MVDKFNFGQLTKEMIVSRLKEISDAPGVAAEIARKTIIAGVRATQASRQDPRETVEEICMGAMSGLLLIEKDLPEGAVRILHSMSEASHELHLDPSEMMTWAMAGIARISALVGPDTRWQIRCAIQEAYMGAGEVFDRLCQEAERK